VTPVEFLETLKIPGSRVFREANGEDFVIRACVVLIRQQSVMDGRTDATKQAMLTLCRNQLTRIRTTKSSNHHWLSSCCIHWCTREIAAFKLRMS